MEGSETSAASETRFRGKQSSPVRRPGERHGARARVALGALVAVNAAAFLVASIVHFGVSIPLGLITVTDATILPAAVAEGAIGIAFVVAAFALVTRQAWAWTGTLGAHLFGILGVLIGLSVTLRDSGDSSPANLLFHEAILPVLVVGLILVLTRSGSAALGRRPVPRGVGP